MRAKRNLHKHWQAAREKKRRKWEQGSEKDRGTTTREEGQRAGRKLS